MTIGIETRRDRTKFGHRDLVIGQHFQKEGLEFFIGPVNLVDQQYRRLFLRDGFQQRAFQQIVAGEDTLLNRAAGLAASDAARIASSCRW